VQDVHVVFVVWQVAQLPAQGWHSWSMATVPAGQVWRHVFW